RVEEDEVQWLQVLGVHADQTCALEQVARPDGRHLQSEFCEHGIGVALAVRSVLDRQGRCSERMRAPHIRDRRQPGRPTVRGCRLDVGAALGTPDGVIVPGGGWLNHAPEGSWAQAQRGTVAARLVLAAASARWLASVCTGGMLLASAGLLAGRYATTNRNAVE